MTQSTEIQKIIQKRTAAVAGRVSELNLNYPSITVVFDHDEIDRLSNRRFVSNAFGSNDTVEVWDKYRALTDLGSALKDLLRVYKLEILQTPIRGFSTNQIDLYIRDERNHDLSEGGDFKRGHAAWEAKKIVDEVNENLSLAREALIPNHAETMRLRA